MNKLQKRIQEAYGACYRLCESDRNACQWLEGALDAARRGEAQHRKGAPYGAKSRYRMPVADAARFFAVKWFLDIQAPPRSYADACSLRPDVLFALGARDVVKADKTKNETWHRLYAEYQDVRELDYCKEIAA